MANPVKWFEIMGEDSVKLQKFYRDTFGWKMTAPVKEMGNYSMLEGYQPGIGGGLGGGAGEARRVTIYVEVDDPQKYLDKALANGATVLMPVTTITPDTTVAMFSDPAGNTTGIMKANPRPAATPSSRTARPRAAGRARASAARPRAKTTTAKRASTAKTKKRATGRTGRTKRR